MRHLLIAILILVSNNSFANDIFITQSGDGFTVDIEQDGQNHQIKPKTTTSKIDGDDVTMKVSETTVKGSSDIDIEGKVLDIKSSAPWAYKNKWAKGFDALLAEDDFGYVGQLFGYADAQNKPPGGWIVVDKSSGELMVVPVTATVDQCKAIRARRKHTVGSLESGAPFQRGFEAEEETFQRKETGKKTLCKSCGFCSFKKTCWPTAQYKPQAESKAKFPPHKWYVDAD